MDKFEYYKDAFRNYTNFSGRANRAQYWYFVLFNFLIAFGLGFVEGLFFNSDSGMGVLGGLYNLAVFVPSLAIATRRLHDIGKSGWNLLFLLIPVVGFFIVLYFMIKPSISDAQIVEPNKVQSKPKPTSTKSKRD